MNNEILPAAFSSTDRPRHLTVNGAKAKQKNRVLQEVVQAGPESQLRSPDEQQMRERQWRLCADAALRIHRCTSVDEAIDILGEAAKDILRARQCVISLRSSPHDAERIFVFPVQTAGQKFGLTGIVSYVRRRIRQTRKALRLSRQELQSRRNGHVYAGIELDTTQVNGLLAVPVPGHDGGMEGLIQASDKAEGDFSESDELLLAQLVQNFTGALDNMRQLGQLREQDRRKDEFLATLAHELRNPLPSIRSGLQLLQCSGDEVLKAATRQTMERQLAHLTLLVDDLLDVSRINLGKLRLRKSRCDLRPVLHTAVEAAQPLLTARDHKLEIDLPQLPLPLEADEARLCQVLINLLNNAAKYTPPRGRITLSVTTQEGMLMLRIQDNGVGISPAMLPRLFDLFLQIDSSAKYAQGGLGVGLPLVRRLIEMHGGTITASSDGLGKGSVFSVALPLAEPAVPAPADASDPVKNAAPGHLEILVVDDNVDSAESLAALLRVGGHEVMLAHEGLKAIEIAEQLKPQVLILDIGLPGISGYEVARVLRRAGTYHPMLIAMTGWGSENDRRLALEAGFDAHLVKPVDIKLLNELLQMSGRQSVQASVASMMPTGEWS